MSDNQLNYVNSRCDSDPRSLSLAVGYIGGREFDGLQPAGQRIGVVSCRCSEKAARYLKFQAPEIVMTGGTAARGHAGHCVCEKVACAQVDGPLDKFG